MARILETKNQQNLRKQEDGLADLAARWRGVEDKNSEYAAGLVRQYHKLLHTLLVQGYTGWLDADAELPRRLMPEEYLNRSGTTVPTYPTRAD